MAYFVEVSLFYLAQRVKLKSEYEAKQKNELTATYKNCEKEVRELNLKPKNLNQYLGWETAQQSLQSKQTKQKIRPYNDIRQIPLRTSALLFLFLFFF